MPAQPFTMRASARSCDLGRLRAPRPACPSARWTVVRPAVGYAATRRSVDHRRKRYFQIAVLILAIAVLVLLFDQLGWAGMRKAVVGTGAWFAAIAAIDVLGACCDALAIRGFLAPRVEVPYATVLAAQLSGMGINRVTPGSSLGEPVKVTMLAHVVPTDLAVSAIVMFNLTTFYIALAAIVIGVPITIALLDLPRAVTIAVWIATAALVAIAVVLAIVVRRGAVATLIDALAKTRVVSGDRAMRWRAAIADIDSRLRELGGNTKRSGLRVGLAGVIASRVLGWVGTLAVLHAADIPLSPVLVVAMLSVGILVSWISNVVPFGLGIADGTNYALYDLLGASPAAGLLFTMVNRLRALVVAVIGLGVMAILHARPARVAARPVKVVG
jgi:hypothetical protein